MGTKIEWTDERWNPVIGCRRVSAGCENCYAEKMAAQRLEPNPKAKDYDGIAEQTEAGPRWTGKVKCLPHKLDEPLSWRKPRRVFVNSMSDLFHEDVPFEFIACVFGIMSYKSQHTFQVLTKRPGRMREFFKWVDAQGQASGEGPFGVIGGHLLMAHDGMFDPEMDGMTSNLTEARFEGGFLGPNDYDVDPVEGWPLPNVWLGVSCEDQSAADERIPPLLECPATVRFVSAEPLLESIDFTTIDDPYHTVHDALGTDMGVAGTIECGCATCEGPGPSPHVESVPPLDWIIVGGESGPDARPCYLPHIDTIVEQCQSADVPVFVKQLGAKPLAKAADRMHPASPDWAEYTLTDSKGGEPLEWPEDLRVREMPEVPQ